MLGKLNPLAYRANSLGLAAARIEWRNLLGWRLPKTPAFRVVWFNLAIALFLAGNSYAQPAVGQEHLRRSSELFQQGDIRNALSEAEQALRIYERNGPAVNHASALFLVGKYQTDLGEFNIAIDALSHAIQIGDQIQFRRLHAFCYRMLANAYLQLGRFEDAQLSFDQSIENIPFGSFGPADERRFRRYLSTDIAALNVARGDPLKASVSYQTILEEIAEEDIGDRCFVTYLLAAALQAAGLPARAAGFLNAARALLPDATMMPVGTSIKVLVLSAEVESAIGRTNAAVKFVQASLQSLIEVQGLPAPDTLYISGRLLGVCLTVGDLESARKIITRADPVWLNQPAAAATKANYATSRAYWFLANNDLEEARRSALTVTKAQDLEGFPVQQAEGHFVLARIASKNSLEDFEVNISRGISLLSPTMALHSKSRANMLLNRSAVRLIRGNNKGAVEDALAVSKSDAIINGDDKASLGWAEGFLTYGFLRRFSPEDIILYAGSPEQRFQILLSKKGAILDDFFASMRSGVEGCNNANQFRRQLYQTLVKNAAFPIAGSTNKSSVQIAIERLELAERECRNYLEKPVTQKGDVKTLPLDAVAIDFVTFPRLVITEGGTNQRIRQVEEYVGALLISRSNGAHWVQLCALSDLTNATARLNRLTMSAYCREAPLVAALNELYRVLLYPLEPFLPKDASKVYISADGPIHFVPFSVLLNDTNEFLGERYRIFNIPSLRSLFRRATPPAATFQAYGLFLEKSAGWSFDLSTTSLRPVDLPPLEYARAEQEAFAASGFALPPKIYLGTNASDQTLRRIRNPRILHLCSHSLYVGDFLPIEMESQLVARNERLTIRLAFSTFGNQLLLHRSNSIALQQLMTGDKETGNDGILTLDEIANLKLSGTELVSLSACSTHLSDSFAGEGLIGMQRAFHTAGARCLLLSLWPVRDAPAPEFFSLLFRRLAKNQTPEMAFSDTIRELLAQKTNRPLKDIVRDVGCYTLSVNALPN